MTLYVGARDPESVEVVVTDATFDFTTVTGTEIEIIHPAGRRVTWSWSANTSVPGRVTLTHVCASTGDDVPEVGDYTLIGWLLTATSRRRIVPTRIGPAVAYP